MHFTRAAKLITLSVVYTQAVVHSNQEPSDQRISEQDDESDQAFDASFWYLAVLVGTKKVRFNNQP